MQLKTLGGLALEDSSFNRPKPLLLLAYLALEGPATRRELADLFFMAAKNPRDSLSTALRYLRNESGTLVHLEGDTVRTDLRCDAVELLRLLDTRMAEPAFRLYGGTFLKGLDMELGSELEEWVYGTREVLAGRVREAYLSSAESTAAEGEFEQAARLAEEGYFLPGAPEPSPEILQRVHALLLAGGSPRAKEVSQEAESFGLGLLLFTKEAREQLRKGFSATGVKLSEIPNNLPSAGASFVGRDPELAELGTLLGRPDVRLITLQGSGGIGKSRLAVELAREQLRQRTFEAGVFFVQLDALTDPMMIPSSIAETLTLSLQGIASPLEQVERFIADKRMLLVLDNYEQLVEGASITSELLETCPNLMLMVTSRERLNTQEEWLFPVEGLAYPQPGVPLTNAQHGDAVRLFTLRAQRHERNFSLTIETLPQVVRICQLVDGMPLAVELAATWIRHMPLEEIAREISRSTDFLEANLRDSPERHRSLRATFEHSWGLLSNRERQMLRQLSVFRGGFRREGASAVVGATLPLLASLVDKSLLRVSSDGRYDRHPLLFQFTEGKLAEHPEEHERLKQAHGHYYLHFVKENEKDFWTSKHKRVLETFEEELDNIRTAWNWAVAGLRLEAVRLYALAVSHAFENRSPEAVAVFAKAAGVLNKTEPEHQAALGNVLIAQGEHLHLLTRNWEAVEIAEQGVELLRPLQEHEGVIRGLYTLARTLIRREANYSRAKEVFEEGLALAEKYQLPLYSAMFITGIAYTDMNLLEGPVPVDVQNLQNITQRLRELGNKVFVSIHLCSVGWNLALNGDLQGARPLFFESLQVADEIGPHWVVAHSLCGLGKIDFDMKSYDEAQVWLQDALKMAERLQDQYIMVAILVYLSRTAMAKGDYAQAATHAYKSLKISQDTGDTPCALDGLVAVSDLYAHERKVIRALELLNLIVHHSATEKVDRKEALQLLNELCTQVPTEEKHAATERGKALKIEEVVPEALEHLSTLYTR